MKKKQANFVKFMTKYLQISLDDRHEPDERITSLVTNAGYRQYWLLSEGIRDHRVGDTGIYSWEAGEGEW